MGRFNSGKMNVFDGENFELEGFDELEIEGTPETFTVFVPTDLVNLSKIPDEYDYDMETSHNTFFWDELLPTLIVYCLTFVLGLVGNVLIIFTISRYRKMKSTTNVFLASLASSDLLLILFCIPVKGLEKPVAESQLEVINQDSSFPSFTYQETKIFLDNDNREKINVIHGMENELTNPFGIKDALSKEHYWEGFIVEQNIQNETESEKLSLMERSLLNSNMSSQVEGLMSKLSKEIKKCSEFVKKLNKSTIESLPNQKSVKESISDSKIMKWKGGYENTESELTTKNLELQMEPMFAYSLWEKTSKPEKLQKYSSQKKLKRCQFPGEQKLKSSSRKCLKFDSGSSLCNAERKRNANCKKPKQKIIGVICCEDCADLKKRITCLEKEVEKIKEIISFCDPQNCKNKTTESPRQKLACHRVHEQQDDQEEFAYYPSLTSSGTIVQKSKTRDLHLKSNTSECQLNVGMEIKMQNVDPDTGQMLGAEVRGDCEQKGNIQCRLFEEGQTPVLLMDADFAYNPLTGMLFKNPESSKATSQSTSVALPLRSSREQTIFGNSSTEFLKSQDIQQAFACTENVSDDALGSCGSRKCVSLESNQLGRLDQQSEIDLPSDFNRSQSLERLSCNEGEHCVKACEKTPEMDLVFEEKESTANPVLRENELECELQRQSRSSLTKSKKNTRAKSYIPTRKKPTPSLVGRSASGTSTLSLGVSTISSAPESCSLASSMKSNTSRQKKSAHIFQKLLLKYKEKINKSTQTYVKPLKNKVSEVLRNHKDMQTDVLECQNEEIQTILCPVKEVGILTDKLKMTPKETFENEAYEKTCEAEQEVFAEKPLAETASNTSPDDWKESSTEVGLQANIQSDEIEKYLKDLRIQKKVNLAIAELCYHLAEGQPLNE